MSVLIFAIEPGRSGPMRLPQNLMTAGIGVTIVCPPDNPLIHTSFCDQRHTLPQTRSGWRMVSVLERALRSSGAKLVIPADEQALALLRAVIGGAYALRFDESLRRIVTDSLAAPESLDMLMFKSRTLVLARRLGLRVPPSATIRTVEEARAFAAGAGLPVFVKHSFSWAGAGVIGCQTIDELGAALASVQSSDGTIKNLARRIAGRDWYPADVPIDIQAAIEGHPAMYCALAWRGKLVAGFAGTPLALSSATGPSTAVRVGPDAALEARSRRLIEATGATGLIGFDFMIDAKEGHAWLLECNARPIQIGHLGYRIGVDLSAELHALLRGAVPPREPRRADRTLDVCLFPYALTDETLPPELFRDIPGADPGLMAYAETLRTRTAVA